MKTQELRENLNLQVLERENIIDSIIAALLTGNHVFLYGPPGNAKTYLCQKIAESLQMRHFIYLMSKTTRPEELFGPFKISALKQDKFERNISGKLPEAELAVLDEIWKADGVILNNLLTVLNERQFDNNGRINVPLQSALCASNEIPEDSSLNALYDRMLFRLDVTYLKNSGNLRKLFFTGLENIASNSFTLADLQSEFEASKKSYEFSEELQDSFIRFIFAMRKNGIAVSDRRAKACIPALQALYFVKQYPKMNSEIFYWITDMLWYSPEERIKIQKVAAQEKFLSISASRAVGFKEQFDGLLSKYNAGSIDPINARAEVMELKQKMQEEFANSEDRSEVVNNIIEECDRLMAQIIRDSF